LEIVAKVRVARSNQIYLSAHIPQAVHVSLDAAMFPSKYERFALYPSELFEKYIQMVGVNKGEHIILYSRGPLGGMMFSAKFAWLFKPGDWTAKDMIAENNIKFEELEGKKGEKLYMERTEEMSCNQSPLTARMSRGLVNFLDARIRGQFDGTEDTGLDPHRVNGSNIPGFKSAPAAELVNENGLMKGAEEIRQCEWTGSSFFMSPYS
uniref:Rhodanese domain-containing protein n=1 Tax=Heligmosomoides polygyrus TaxID=6339 RepID=A0A183G9P3_HELPZ